MIIFIYFLTILIVCLMKISIVGFFHTMGPDGIRDWLLELTKTPYTHFFITRVDQESGQFVGISQLAIDLKSNTADIAISVLPEYRNKGIACQLVTMATRIAERLKLENVSFQCEMGNRGCRALFTSLGFESKYDSTQQCITGFKRFN